jgi:DNA-binding NtrC family response regulator
MYRTAVHAPPPPYWDTDSPRARLALYLAYEAVRLARPRSAERVENRFKALAAYQRAAADAGWSAAEAAPEYNRLSLTLREDRPSGKFIPAVVDAVFYDFLKLHQIDRPVEARRNFCDQELGRFFEKYFPEIDRRGPAFQRLVQICRNLKTEITPQGTPEEGPEAEAALTADGRYYLESHNPAWRALMDLVKQAAWSKAPILLIGESGVGKEVLANRVHALSPRADGPFVPINCGALPDNLLESELFGYVKGAFTGADRDKPGWAALADGGTLFLDEIGRMSPRLQVKLLRFLQDYSVQPVGGVKTVEVDVRVVAATNVDLDRARAEGTFRDDLYYRLNVFRLHLPPLKDRPEDIAALADHFIRRYNRENQTHVRGVDESAMDLMVGYHWPGNVRELENVIQRGVILARTGLISARHLPPELTAGRPPAAGRETSDGEFNREGVIETLTAALGRGGLGRSVPLDQLAAFFADRGRRPFAPRDLAEYITPPGALNRRDKLAGQLIKVLTAEGVLEHNGRKAQAARCRFVA